MQLAACTVANDDMLQTPSPPGVSTLPPSLFLLCAFPAPEGVALFCIRWHLWCSGCLPQPGHQPLRPLAEVAPWPDWPESVPGASYLLHVVASLGAGLYEHDAQFFGALLPFLDGYLPASEGKGDMSPW